MYWVIAADGQRYGPADLPTLRQWCQEGRITADTQIVDPIDGVAKTAKGIPEIAQYIPMAGPPTQAPGYNPGAYMHGMNPSYPQFPSPYTSNYPRAYAGPPKSKVASALFAFFLGTLGIHRFYMGHNGTGLAMLLITVLTCGYGAAITWVWSMIDLGLILSGSLQDSDGQALE